MRLPLRILEALGYPCLVCSGAVTIVLQNPHDRSAFSLAAGDLGLRGRRALERRMRKDGFPPLRHLQDWFRTLTVLDGFEQHGYSLQQQAFAATVEPAVLARAVHRVTGLTWVAARQQGTAVWLPRFRDEVAVRVTCRRAHASGR